MNRLIDLLLLADGVSFRNLGDNFRGERAQLSFTDMLVGLLMLAAIAVGVWLLSRYLSHHEGSRRIHNPRGLFKELAKAHGLDWSSRQLLWDLAQAHGLEHPSCLFLEPERLAAEQVPASLAGSQPQLDLLRKKLFEGPHRG